MTSAEPGHLIDGRFQLIQRLGHGGMGAVWRAMDQALHREVALKEVRPADPGQVQGPGAEATLRERVLREARALARLNHPHVVRIYHIVDVAPFPWLVMELVRGESLEARAARGPVPAHEAARYGRHVLSALRAAHAEGIHHRDVKPANVLLREDGSAVLTDFGIAAIAGTSSLTMTGGIIGSPEYIAPERVRGRGDEPAADFWSLGIMLYILTEGYSPLRRGTTLATLSAVLEDPVPPPARSGPLSEVLTALLVKDPAARPRAARLDAMLTAAEQGWSRSPTETAAVPHPAPTAAPDATTGTAPTPPRGGHRLGLITAAAGAALVIGVGATAAVMAMGGPDTRERPGAGGGTGSETPGGPEAETPVASPPDTEESPEESPEEVGEGEDGEGEEDEEGRWVAQLFSEPAGSGTGVRDERLGAVRATVPDAEVLLSTDYPSLRPGYWFIYAPGPFADGHEALAYCAAHGLTTGNECVGRYLSRDPGDADLLCNPDDLANSRCEDD
ncbi:serine/threonine-protein kinase [Streptomyces sp. SBT349]|uniref:serine/threonine-protein kinase n=1 Tax=Streptomyces sp. SBT349 TaxID=1580539 RepID=UPI00066AD9EE|nr:serine/threonine-protein kinase [Streptomyces sp. SBT349]